MNYTNEIFGIVKVIRRIRGSVLVGGSERNINRTSILQGGAYTCSRQ